jgi:hypothetical protein
MPRTLLTLSTLLIIAGVAGCSDGVRWRGFDYRSVHNQSKRENKLTFVYLRSAYLVECTRFEENVLRDPAVLNALRDLNCAVIDFGWDSRLAEKWKLERAPAFAIVNPAGELLSGGFGAISAEQLLEAVAEARTRFAAESARGARN